MIEELGSGEGGGSNSETENERSIFLPARS